MFNKIMNKIGLPTVLALIAILALSYGMLLAKNLLDNYLTITFTKPFLVQPATVYTHKLPALQATTIKQSQIEYSILKVPAVKTTAAKK